MATELGTAYLSIGASTKNMAKDIYKEFGVVEKQADAVGKRIGSSLSAGLLKFAGGVAAAVGISAIGKEAITASDATDKFKNTLDFAGIKTDKIDQLAASAKKYADDTVYSLGDIQSITAQLAANSVKNYDKMAEAAGNLNAVAGGNAQTFAQVGLALVQVNGNGKLFTQDWNQIASAIPGASGKLQEAMKKNGAFTGNFRDAMSKGEITAEEFNKALLDIGMTDVAKEAATSTKTFEGAWGNLQASLVSGAMGLVDKVKPQITSLMGGVSNLVTNGFAKLESVLPRIGAALSAVGAFVMQSVVPALQAMWTWIASNLAPVITGTIIPALSSLGSWLTGTIVPGVAALLSWMQQNTAVWMPFVSVIVAAVAAFKTYNLAMAAYRTVTGLVTAAQVAFNAVLLANPIGLIIAAVAALVAGLTLFFTKTEIGRQIWETVWGAIQSGFNAFVEWIKPILADVSSAWAVTWERMKAIWSAVGPPLIATIRNHIDALKIVFTTVFNVIKSVVTTAFNQIKAVVQTVMGVIQGVIKTYTSLIKGDWQGAWDGIKQIFSSFANGIINIAKNAVSGMFGAGKAIIDGLWQGLQSGFGKVQDGLNWLTSKLPDWKGPKQKDKKLLTPAGKTIILGFVKGLESGYDGVKKSLTKFTDALGKISTSKLTKGQNAQLKATKTWAKSMSKTTKGIWDDGKYKGSVGRWSGLNSGTTNLLRSLTASGNWRKTAKGAYQKVASKTIKSATLADIGKAQDGVQKLLDKAKASLSELKKARADMKAQIADSIKSELDITSGMTTGSGHFLTGQAGFKAVAGSVKTMAAKAKKFAGKLKSLVAKGIPAGLVQEVAGLGTDKGMQVADALLAGTSAQVKELKADYSSLGSWSKKAGDYVAGQMYDTGIQAQNGLIKGLESDAAKLTKAAEKLAGKLVKAVKKALGIKSPSRVFRDQIGAMVDAGLADGIGAGLSLRAAEGLAVGIQKPFSNVNPDVRVGQRLPGSVAGSGDGRRLSDADIAALAAVLEGRPVEVHSTTEFKLDGRPLALLKAAMDREAGKW